MKKIKALMLALGILISTNLFAVSLTPSSFGEVIDYNDSGYKEYRIENDSPERVRYKLDFLGDKEKFDIQVYPKVVLLEPYEEKTIKVLIKKKKNTIDGEYKFVATINPIRVPIVKETSGRGVQIDAKAGVALAVDMYGYVGELGNPKDDVKINILNYDKKNQEVSFNIENNMERSFKVSAIVFKDRKEYEIFSDIVRVGKKKNYKSQLQLKKLDKIDYIEFYNAETDEKISTIKL